LYAITLLAQRRFEEAASELTRTLSADPLLAEASVTFGRLYMSHGQPDRALPYLHDAVELSPMSLFARVQLGHAYLQQGKHDEATAEFERATATGGATESAHLAYAYAVSGRRAEAMSTLRALVAPTIDRYTPPVQVAMAYVGLGDVDEAFRWLDRAYSEHAGWLITVNVAPPFAPLRSDPRFTSLLRKIRLAP
jgi:tetratricopeptide (TPR) repeat protein